MRKYRSVVIFSATALFYSLHNRKQDKCAEDHSAAYVYACTDTAFYLELLPEIVKQNELFGREVEIRLRGNRLAHITVKDIHRIGMNVLHICLIIGIFCNGYDIIMGNWRKYEY